MVSCVFANDAKEYLVVGTAYVREDVSKVDNTLNLLGCLFWFNAVQRRSFARSHDVEGCARYRGVGAATAAFTLLE